MLEAGDDVIPRIAAAINFAQSELNKHRADLELKLAPMKTGFQGAAGTAFDNLMLAWHDKQRLINNALTDFESALQGAHKVNEGQDADSSASFAHLTGRMGS